MQRAGSCTRHWCAEVSRTGRLTHRASGSAGVRARDGTRSTCGTGNGVEKPLMGLAGADESGAGAWRARGWVCSVTGWCGCVAERSSAGSGSGSAAAGALELWGVEGREGAVASPAMDAGVAGPSLSRACMRMGLGE